MPRARDRSQWVGGFGFVAMQKLPGSGFAGACKVEAAAAEEFPAGLRVLVVDDDTSCLRILEQMLRKCRYHVTTCCQASFALSLLRERKGSYDLVISDVHMPDMDGFKLLEHVGLEMDLPVIMMSADGRTSAVMRGIRHGACDYLIKPVRMEELKNIWQHVVRKKWNGNKEHEHSGSLDDSDRQRRGGEDDDYASSVNDGNDNNWKGQKKKREAKEDEEEGDLENDDSSAAKKPRVVWSVELHQQFVGAVNQLGIDKAVPKRILELMNVPGLTRENVASHLQKFRLYLKRLSGVAQQQIGISNTYGGPIEANPKASALGRLDFQALAASAHIPPHAMTAFHSEMLGRSSGEMVLPELDPPPLMHHSGGRYLPPECGIAFGQPLGKCQSSLPKMFPQTSMVLGDMSSGFASWSPNVLAPSCPTGSNSPSVNLSTGNMLMQQMPPQQQSQSILSESSNAINLGQEAHTINVQPSCLISPSRSSDDFNIASNVDSASSLPIPPSLTSIAFQAGSAAVPVIQSSGANARIPAADYTLLSPPLSDLSHDIGRGPDGDYKSITMLNGYSLPGSALSVSSAFSCSEDTPSWKQQNPSSGFIYTPSGILPGHGISTGDIQNSLVSKGILMANHGHTKNSGFGGKVISIPSRFAVDDLDPAGDVLLRSYSNDGGRGRQEIHLDFVEGSKLENATMSHSSSSDLMSILSK